MFRNYILTAYRNLLKHKTYTWINILGLSIGLACFIFIWMYVDSEYKYDKHFPNYNQIYRVTVKGNMAGSQLNQAVTAAPLAKTLRSEVPGVISATRMAKFGDWLVRYNDKKYNETRVLFADSCFFNVFNIPLIQGDRNTALNLPYSIIITENTAKRYFGNENPIGKMLRFEADSTYYTVTGIIDLPENTHFHFDFLASLSSIKFANNNYWISHFFYTYFLAEKDYPVKKLKTSLNEIVLKYVVKQVESALDISIEKFSKAGNTYEFLIQPLKDIHLKSHLQVELEPNGNSVYITIFVAVAFLILLIACINFMNLSTARASIRAKEVAIRKVVGAQQVNLIWQYIGESLFLSFLALGISLVLVEILTPFYNSFIQKDLNLSSLLTTFNITFLISVVLFSGLISGLYPAIVIASFSPIQVIKGNLTSRIKSSGVRNILVIGQFVASIVIIIFTCASIRQLSYIRRLNLGFDKERTIVIKRSDGLKNKIDAFKDEVNRIKGVLAIGNSTHIPGKNYWYNSFLKEDEPYNTYLLYHSLVSTEFADALGIKMKEGRFFSKDVPSDSFGIVINESAAKMLHFDHPIGQTLQIPIERNKRENLTVIGVMENFNFKSLHFKIEPMAMTLMKRNVEGYLVVRIKSDDFSKTMQQIERKWDLFTSDYPFEYFWLDEDLGSLYSSEIRLSGVFSFFSFLSIFIACLGLLGMIAYTSNKRKKEIGIRKILGATNEEIMYTLGKDILRLFMFALIIGWPLSFFIIKWWLSDYSYRIPMNYPDFMLAAAGAFLVALFTISFQIIKSTSKNPSEAIRYE